MTTPSTPPATGPRRTAAASRRQTAAAAGSAAVAGSAAGSAVVAAAVATAIAAVALVAGCTGSAGSPNREVAAPTPAQLRELGRAEESLVATCMRDQGFEYHIVAADPALDEQRDFPYGIDDPTWAARHGLGLALRAKSERRAGPTNPNNVYTDSLDPQRRNAYSDALFGTGTRVVSVTIPTGEEASAPVDGCLASAQAALYGDVTRWFPAKTITNNLAGAIQPKIYADQRYQQAAAAWSTCMAGYGHDYRDPTDLRGRFAGGSAEQERQVATAEADCVLRTGLAATGAQLDRELGAPVRKRYAADIRACHTLQTAALRRVPALTRTRTDAAARD